MYKKFIPRRRVRTPRELSVYKNGRISFSRKFSRIFDLKKYKFITFFYDEGSKKAKIQFSDRDDDGTSFLIKGGKNESSVGFYVDAKGFFSHFKINLTRNVIDFSFYEEEKIIEFKL